MIPTSKLRWYVRKNKVAEIDIVNYSRYHDVNYIVAKQELEATSMPVLQQWWENNSQEEVCPGEWRDIPFVMEIIE